MPNHAEVPEVPSIGVVAFRAPDLQEVLVVESGSTSEHITGTVGLVAGRLEPGETLIEAAARELGEESGLKAQLENLIPLSTIYKADIPRRNGEVIHFIWHVFLCTAFTGEIQANSETIPKWVKRDQLANLPLLPNVEAAITEAAEMWAKMKNSLKPS